MKLTRQQLATLQTLNRDIVAVIPDRIAAPLKRAGLIEVASVQSRQPGTWYSLTAKGYNACG